MNTALLLTKLILTPLIVALVTLVARRWGESIGGLLIGLPLTSGPVSVFLVIEQGRHFAAGAANAAILGLIPVTAFYSAYVLSARRFPWYGSALIGILFYALVVTGVSVLPLGPSLTTLVVPLVLAAGVWILGKREAVGTLISPPWWDLPGRMVLATLLLVLITSAASTLGSKWSGLLSPFPIFTSVMVTFSHRQGGLPAARRLIQGVSLGLFSYVVFFLVVRALIEKINLVGVYALATFAALLINGTFLSIQLWRRRTAMPVDRIEG
jgi:uncharacterized membrane protein (GlpM family)